MILRHCQNGNDFCSARKNCEKLRKNNVSIFEHFSKLSTTIASFLGSRILFMMILNT